jgi:DNA gyrase subunit A
LVNLTSQNRENALSDLSSSSSLIQPISIEKEMQRSYLDYAMSVIVSRALPDVRDGLKPVHRRILYAMYESGCDYNKPYKKSARIVGEVMGKYHPHGDSAIYDALVRMAQPFSMSQMLIDGQGNFGSMDGDPPAAMRYTESRLDRIAQTALLADIDQDTVSFQDNYDGSEREPMVLPARYPNILVNGAGGIAVGMATNMPPHNLGEVVDATCMLIENPQTEIDELMQVIPAPDFPTGGIILGRSGSRSAAHTGRGSVIMRAKTHFEEISGKRTAIIATEMPYQVNKARLVEKIAELVRDKRIDGITDLRDESDKQGVRVVIELRRDTVPEVVLNQLFSLTPLQTSFGVNALALNEGRPVQLNLKQILEAFIAFREEVVTRRTAHLLNKARDKAHNLIGLAIAVANIDEVIKVIRGAPNPVVAKEELMSRDWDAADVLPLLELVDDRRNSLNGTRIKFTEEQARGILELRLQRLTGLEREKINGELAELGESIKDYLDILSSRPRRLHIMKQELLEVRAAYAIPRRTQIEDSEFESDIENLIQKEDMVVTVTAGGYIKRVPLDTYRSQRRGGKGRSGMSMKEEDAIEQLFVANTHTPVLFFSNYGKVYKLKVYGLPLGGATTKGKALVNIFPLAEGETINTFMPLPEDESTWDSLHVMFSTSMGTIRRNDLSDFQKIQSNGKIAMKLDDGEQLIGVLPCEPTQDVLLASSSGKSVRFPVHLIRVFQSRNSVGVRAMKLSEGDHVVSMSILGGGADVSAEERAAYLKKANQLRRTNEAEEDIVEVISDDEAVETSITEISDARFNELANREQFIFTITENGFGKRTSSYEYRVTGRGGSGIVNIITSARNGRVVGSFPLEDNDQLMLMTDSAKLIRCGVNEIRVTGRNTQGVTIFKIADDEKVVSAVRIAASMISGDDDDEIIEVEQNHE